MAVFLKIRRKLLDGILLEFLIKLSKIESRNYWDFPFNFCFFVLLSLWNDFDPIMIGITDKINSHFWVFEADTA